MQKINKHIEIVRSNISGLSSLSEISAGSIYFVLSKHFTKVGITTINNFSDLEALVSLRPDLVFLGMEFIPTNILLGVDDPEKIWISEFLESHRIAYTGSGRSGHELGRNKHLAKQRVLDSKLSTSAFNVIEQNKVFGRDDIALTFPVFIKPTNRGGGLGIDSDSVANDFNQVQRKVSSITNELHSDALIEEYLPGREFSVAILKDEHSSLYSTMPIELVAPQDKNGDRLLGSEIKSSNTEIVLEVTDHRVKDKVSALALAVFHAINGRDYGRIDIRLDGNGNPNFLEANLIPSLISGYGSFPKACLINIDLDYEPMILRIVRLGLTRQLDDSYNNLDITDPNLIFSNNENTVEII